MDILAFQHACEQHNSVLISTSALLICRPHGRTATSVKCLLSSVHFCCGLGQLSGTAQVFGQQPPDEDSSCLERRMRFKRFRAICGILPCISHHNCTHTCNCCFRSYVLSPVTEVESASSRIPSIFVATAHFLKRAAFLR